MTYHANRGVAFEHFVETANLHYSEKNIARIDKISTPIRVVSMRGNIITKAFWANKSTVDFIGCLNDGRMVAFDCKECSSDRFPLSNIKEHQYGYLRQINEYGGKAFILLYFSKLFRFARLDFDNLQKYWELKECQNGKRGTCSIPASELLVNEIKINGMILDYLGGVEWKSSTL